MKRFHGMPGCLRRTNTHEHSRLGIWCLTLTLGFPKIRDTFRGPHKEDYSALGSILGSAILGNYPLMALGNSESCPSFVAF